MPLLPELDALTIKRLNQGEVSLDHLPTPDLVEILLATEPVGNSEGSGIYRVTNRLEVILPAFPLGFGRISTPGNTATLSKSASSAGKA